MDASLAKQAPQKSDLFTRRFVMAWAALSVAYGTIMVTGLGNQPYMSQWLANTNPFKPSVPASPAWWEIPTATLIGLIEGLDTMVRFPEAVAVASFIIVLVVPPIAVGFVLAWAGRKLLGLLSRQGQATSSGRV